jgi:hypothetical protein
MPRLLLLGAFALALGAPAPAARALTIVTLALDPGASAVTPDGGAPQSLSGTITLAIGTLPLGGSNTTFDVVDLAVVASGGAAFALDPSASGPGLGVLKPAGAFLVPTLFLRITDGAAEDVAIPDVTGSVVFGPGAASIEALSVAFDLATAGGLVHVGLLAVPEPATIGLLAAGLAALAVRRAGREGAR